VLETLEGSIGGSGIATPVVGVDYETAAKGRLQTRIRSRQLARVGRHGLQKRIFHGILFDNLVL
jgi:hypothetical protein